MRLPEKYRTISNLSGPLMMVNKVQDVSYDELAEITLGDGEHRRGRVLELDQDRALVQVYEGSSGNDVTSPVIRLQRTRRPHRRRPRDHPLGLS